MCLCCVLVGCTPHQQSKGHTAPKIDILSVLVIWIIINCVKLALNYKLGSMKVTGQLVQLSRLFRTCKRSFLPARNTSAISSKGTSDVIV